MTTILKNLLTKTNPIQLYIAGTPNGHKISILLEELSLKYDVKPISFQENEQKQDWFLKINPNGRIPAIVDPNNNNFPVFESGAIMLYLTEKYDQEHKLCHPFGSDLYWQTLTWLFFQNAGVGPMQGQSHHFFRYAPEKIEYSINRYQNETRRLYSVLENRLKENGEWLVGDKLTIADLANFPWVNLAFWAGVEISEFTKLNEWAQRIEKREAVQRGLNVPTEFKLKKEYLADKEKTNTKHGAENAAWILKGQEADAKRK